MQGTGRRRRALLVSLSWLFAGSVLVTSTVVLAQDPRTTEAQRVAREWLAKSDAGDARATYEAAAAKFKAALTLEQWTDATVKARAPFGAVRTRSLASAQAAWQVPDLPDGTYVLLVYRTSFANRDTSETVTMEREGDGVWRVVGYSIR